jgi:hypothetical protein
MLVFPCFILVPLLQTMVVRQQSLCDLGYTFSFSLTVTLKNRTGPQQPGFYWAFELFIRECAWCGKTAAYRGPGSGAISTGSDPGFSSHPSLETPGFRWQGNPPR